MAQLDEEYYRNHPVYGPYLKKMEEFLNTLFPSPVQLHVWHGMVGFKVPVTRDELKGSGAGHKISVWDDENPAPAGLKTVIFVKHKAD
jgi:hypothetical protein